MAKLKRLSINHKLTGDDFALVWGKGKMPGKAVATSVGPPENKSTPLAAGSAPPLAFTWRGKSQLPPVGQQLPFNTCVAHAGARMLESAEARAGRKIRLDPEAFHQCVLGRKCELPEPDAAIALTKMQSPGVPRASGFEPGTPCKPGMEKVASALVERIIEEKAIKSYIAATGPVVAVIAVAASFQNIRDATPYKDKPGQPTIDHAVLLIGYDDNLGGGVWWFQNSFGTGWGDDGFGTLAYGHGRLLSDPDHPALCIAA